MKNVIASSAKQFTTAFFLLVALILFGCAKREPEPDFRPLQIHWNVAAGEDESQMPHKDECVIMLTGRLMADPVVAASTAGELTYEVIYARSSENPEIIVFRGFCRDLPLDGYPECNWSATCDKDLKTVVKFDNGV